MIWYEVWTNCRVPGEWISSFVLSGSILGGIRDFGVSVEATHCTDNVRVRSDWAPQASRLTANVSVRRAFAK